MPRLTLWSGALAVAALSLAGCTSHGSTTSAPASASGAAASGGAAAAVFHLPENFQPNSAAASCLLHQDANPTTAYMGGESATPALQLPFMAYLRANGNKPFCDGKAATDIDKKWAALYVTLTTNAADVAGINK